MLSGKTLATIAISTLISFLFSGCEETDPKITDDPIIQDTIPSSMMQEHIPWASLADSPWPMYSHDPQGTRRSQYTGPTLGEISWQLWTDGIQKSNGFTSFGIGSDSTLYFGSSYERPEGSQSWLLYAVSNSGEVEWTFRDPDQSHEEIEVSPLITNDGTIIFATYYFYHANIYSLSVDGQLLWKYEHDLSPFVGDYLNIGLDGTIYFIDGGGNLIALNDDGTLKWQLLANQAFKANGQWCTAISPDGNTLYVSGAYGYDPLYAVSSDGQLQWSMDLPDSTARITGLPLVDNQGNIYLGVNSTLTATEPPNSGFYSLNSDGSIRWIYPKVPIYEMYTMDSDGHIYLSTGDELFAIAYNGTELWNRSLSLYSNTPLIIDNSHTIYITGNNLQAIDGSQGTTLWTMQIPETVFQCPVIGIDNTLFLGFAGSDSNKYVYAIK